jgi:hypothetical protein
VVEIGACGRPVRGLVGRNADAAGHIGRVARGGEARAWR